MKQSFWIFALAVLLSSCSAPGTNTATELVVNPTTIVSIEPTNKTEEQTPQPTPSTADILPQKVDPIASSNPDLMAPELSGSPTDHSITINVIPAIPMTIFIEYGEQPGQYIWQTAPQSVPAGIPVNTELDNLKPNTSYYYRVSYNNKYGPEHRFTTQREPGSTFRFALIGDSHPEREQKQFDQTLYCQTLTTASQSLPDFFFTIGDDFSVDALKVVNPETVRGVYLQQRQFLTLPDAPIYLVNGNHEQASMANLDGSADNVAVWAQTTRNSYFPLPIPNDFYSGDTQQVKHIGYLRDYYAFTWGDALFVVIDPYWHSPVTVDNQFGADRSKKVKRDLWEVTIGDAQYQWLKTTLQTSDAKYKFVFAHHVMGTGRGGIELADSYEWGDAKNLSAHRPGWDMTIQELFRTSGVTIFFQGHDHIFVKQELDGVIYQSLPEPANPNYSFENESAYKSGEKFPNSGYVEVTVSPESVKVQYIRTYLERADEVAFTYEVKE